MRDAKAWKGLKWGETEREKIQERNLRDILAIFMAYICFPVKYYRHLPAYVYKVRNWYISVVKLPWECGMVFQLQVNVGKLIYLVIYPIRASVVRVRRSCLRLRLGKEFLFTLHSGDVIPLLHPSFHGDAVQRNQRQHQNINDFRKIYFLPFI